MRLNRFLALHTDLSRRAADTQIELGNVQINGNRAHVGATVSVNDQVTYNGQLLSATPELITILFNKPIGYVCSRRGQGSNTIHDILPKKYKHLNPVGRLDKNSSGLLVLTNDGNLANQLTHPRYAKKKIYQITLDKPLQPLHQQMINDFGIQLDDGLSKLLLHKTDEAGKSFEVTMTEGRNRQIRRTFSSLGYSIEKLHRTQFGDYQINDLSSGDTLLVT